MGISTHILDTALGRPAADVPVSLARRVRWCLDAAEQRHHRCGWALQRICCRWIRRCEAGIYRVHFATAIYYETQEMKGLYPYVDIVFEIRDSEQHYHIPLLLTANGYTTYRGS